MRKIAQAPVLPPVRHERDDARDAPKGYVEVQLKLLLKRVVPVFMPISGCDFNLANFFTAKLLFDRSEIFANRILDIFNSFGVRGALRPTSGQARH